MSAFEEAKKLGRDLKSGIGKAALNLIPYDAIVEIAKVASFGAAKYPPGWTWTSTREGWREKYGSAVVRHAIKWADPTLPNVDVDIDPSTGDDLGSGISHMAHAGFNAMICLWHEVREIRERRESQPMIPSSVVVRPIAGRALKGHSLVNVLLPLSQIECPWNTIKGRGGWLDSRVIIDSQGRWVVFECPNSVAAGDEVTVVVGGAFKTVLVDRVDFKSGILKVELIE